MDTIYQMLDPNSDAQHTFSEFVSIILVVRVVRWSVGVEGGA